MEVPMGRVKYAFVARGTVVLFDCARSRGNFETIAIQALEKLPEGLTVATILHGKHTLNYLLENGFAYMALADKDLPHEAVFSFLKEVKEDFQKKCGDTASTCAAHSLDRHYGSDLKDRMKKADKPVCRLRALPEALMLKIVLKSATSSPKAPFVWRSLCRKLRTLLSLQSDHVWKRCFIAAYRERIAFEAALEQLHSALSPWLFSLKFTCMWMLKFAERLVAGGNWKNGRGRVRSVTEDAIMKALIAFDKLNEFNRDAVNALLWDTMKLESNLLFLALCAYIDPEDRGDLGCPIVVWNLEEEAVKSICVGHKYKVQTLEANRGASMLMSGGHDEIRVWEVASGRCLCYVPSVREGPWGLNGGSLKSLQWGDADGGVVRDASTGAPIPKERVIEEFEEWDQRTGASRTCNEWPAISNLADHSIPGYAEYWGAKGQRDTLLNASQQNVLGCAPRGRTLLGRECLHLEDKVLHWVFIYEYDPFHPGRMATVWSASPRDPTPHPIRRFKGALCFDNRTSAIALQGSSRFQFHVADAITGEELQTLSLSRGSNEATDMAENKSADFSHSDVLGWCLVFLLESNLLLVVNVTTGHPLVRLECGPGKSFYSLSPLGRIFTLECPWTFLDDVGKLPPSRNFSLIDVETETRSRFEDLGKRGKWVPLQVKNLVGGDPSATSIWLGPGNASIVLWTGDSCAHVATLPLASSSNGSRPYWKPFRDEIDTNWRWLAILDFNASAGYAIHIWDLLLGNNSQGS